MTDLPRPARSGAKPRAGIVHFGPGAFFRAFNAVYTQDVLDSEGGDWGIVAVSLRSATARDQLVAQDCVYTSVTLGEGGRIARRIGSIVDVLVAPEDPAAVLATMRDPAIRVVSLTITEKGYCHDPATGRLNWDHPDIASDLANLAEPKSAIGFVAAALAQRKAAGVAAFTVLSCDNLPANGAVVRGLVLDFARKVDAALCAWIDAKVTFPSTMVDRITPATTVEDVEALAKSEGYHDPACVCHEAFRQWVIEDDFAADRPDWDLAGAQFVDDVTPFEEMKLRCLNGTHSTLAYLGFLAGHETIAEAVADPAFEGLCRRLWSEEIIPTLNVPVGTDLGAYCATLLKRYQDRSIRHRTQQIAMDGSQKLPQRILGTIADNLAAGRVPKGLILAVAGWVRYVGGVDEKGQAIAVSDPLASELKRALDAAERCSAKVDAVLAFDTVFPRDLVRDDRFRGELVLALEGLVEKGAAGAVRAFVMAT